MPWMCSSYIGRRAAQAHVRSQGNSVIATLCPSEWVTAKVWFSYPLKQEELIARANYKKIVTPWDLFLRSKGKSQKQETPAQRSQNLHGKKYNCQRAYFISHASHTSLWQSQLRVSEEGEVALSPASFECDQPSLKSCYEEPFAIATHHCGF